MKKKGLWMGALLLVTGVMGGCASDGADGPLKDMNVEKYVTVGEYIGLEVNASSTAIDEAELENMTASLFQSMVTAESGGITDRVVEEGDTVNINFVGTMDGVAFEGGTADNQLLTIGSGSYIDGFESGLVGVMPGTATDLELTFPDNYGSDELAGQDVIFNVTVNFIMPEISDAVVAAFGVEDYTTVDELRQYVKDYMISSNESNYQQEVESLVLEAFMQNCVFKEIPENMAEKYRKNIQTNLDSMAASYGTDAETLVSTYYGTTLEEFLEQYGQESVRQSIAFQAVANREDLNITDEELDERMAEDMAAGNYATEAEFLGETTREDYREYLMFDRVMTFILDNAVVTPA
jgi:trigger factor